MTVDLGPLHPGLLLDALALPLEHEPVAAEQVVAGSPTTGYAVLVDGPPEIGLWEMTPGTASDVEVDEVFVVLAGHGTVRFDMPLLEPITLRPGSVVRLTAGMHTTWHITETLRKLFIA